MTIQHVRQEDQAGCGIACVAMVTGRSYAEVRAAYTGEFGGKNGLPEDFDLTCCGNGAGLDDEALSFLLKHFAPDDHEQRRALIKRTEFEAYGLRFGHFIVEHEGRIYDPAKDL